MPGLPPLPALRVDRMLARLARWLRLLGADAESFAGDGEDELIASLRGEPRMFVTRHRRRTTRLERLGLPVLLLAANDLGGQLREVAARWALPPPEARFSRCGWCNAVPRPVGRAEAAPWIPAFVARTQQRFVRCPRCGRIYWRATQTARFARDLARLLAH